MNHISEIISWNDIADNPTGPKAAALYLGLMCEEMAETLRAAYLVEHADILAVLGEQLKHGEINVDVNYHNRPAMLDGAVDTVWTAVGFARAIKGDVLAAFDKVQEANYAKFVNGECVRNPRTGKIMKPEGWQSPDISDCFYS